MTIQQETKEQTPRWYVVHTYSGQEERVRKNLEHRVDSLDVRDRVFRVIVPTEDEVEIRGGQKRTVTRKVFPGYILVEMLMDDETWRVVRETPGVTGFVSSGDPPRPVPLDEREVQSILHQMEAEAPRVRVGYQKGQSVRITDGPFTDFIGTVEDVNADRGKVTVMVSFFGRETPVELDFLQIEKL
jgi:transcriptional antiterminator NusG